MAHILSYANGVAGYGLSDDLDEAIEDAVDRCEMVEMGANILSRSTLNVVAEIRYVNGLYKATKKD